MPSEGRITTADILTELRGRERYFREQESAWRAMSLDLAPPGHRVDPVVPGPKAARMRADAERYGRRADVYAAAARLVGIADRIAEEVADA